jgi:hypothetical protein
MSYKEAPTIIKTLLIIMLGETIMISYGVVGAESAKSGIWSDWCYISAFPEDRWVCFPEYEECKKAESSDIFKSNPCYKHKS